MMMVDGDCKTYVECSLQKEYSEKLTAKLDQIMFSESKISVEGVIYMLQAVRIRHGLNQTATSDLLQLIKILAGPSFEKFQFSKYFLNQFCSPKENIKFYTFYCKPCEKILKELCTKDELKIFKTAECPKCKKEYKLTTSMKNYFVNIDLEYQIKSLFMDSDILNYVVDCYDRNKCGIGRKKDLVIRDIFDSELYKKKEFIVESQVMTSL